jgi:hypothetical protein
VGGGTRHIRPGEHRGLRAEQACHVLMFSIGWSRSEQLTDVEELLLSCGLSVNRLTSLLTETVPTSFCRNPLRRFPRLLYRRTGVTHEIDHIKVQYSSMFDSFVSVAHVIRGIASAAPYSRSGKEGAQTPIVLRQSPHSGESPYGRIRNQPNRKWSAIKR